jgi:hypothetical protein
MPWFMHTLKLFFIIGCIFLSTSLPAQSEWKLYKSDSDNKVWLKDIKGSSLKQFKLQTIIKENLSTLYKIMKDVENMNVWYDKVKNVKLLNKISDNEAIYLLEYDLPFPFEDRITTIKGSILYDKINGLIKVSTAYYPYAIPQEKAHLLVINKISSSWEIRKISESNASIIHSGYMDPGGNIPEWLINEGVTSGPLKTLEKLRKHAKNIK